MKIDRDKFDKGMLAALLLLVVVLAWNWPKL